MTIILVYREDGGFAAVEVDDDGIDFVDGKACINVVGSKQCMVIPVEKIVSVNGRKV